MDKKNIVIIGAGFGGLRAAIDIARGLKNLHLLDSYAVTLIDRNNCHLFIPLLYKVAARPEPEHEDACTYKINDLLQDIPVHFIQGEVTTSDITTGTITLKNGQSLHADYLILALGSETNYFNIPGLKEHSLQLKTIETAREIRNALAAAFARGGEVKIIAGGGGPNGIELASEIRLWADQEEKKNKNLHVSVSIVEAMPSILTGFDPKIISLTTRRLGSLRIAIQTNMKITSVHEHEIIVGNETNENAQSIPFDVFIWTGGTKTPDLFAALPLEKEKRGKPMASADMTCLPAPLELTLAPMVYAIGDNVCYLDPKTQKPVPGVAHAALSEGAIAAHNLLEEIRHTEDSSSSPRLKTFNPGTLTYSYVIPMGEAWAISKVGALRLTGWLGWEMGRLVELNYLTTIMTPFRAFKAWKRM